MWYECIVWAFNSDMSINQLTGVIPTEIGNLHTLSNLYVVEHIAIITRLTFIYRYLCNNQLTGSIPSSIGSLTSLTLLYAMCGYYLMLRAGGCTQINWVDLFHHPLVAWLHLQICMDGCMICMYQWHLCRALYTNQLTGSIPLSIGNLTALMELYDQCLFIVSNWILL